MPIAFMNTGEVRTVLRITGEPKVRRHLENLGFVEGTPVRIVTVLAGDLIVQVKDARVAISRELAMKIFV